MATDYQAQYGPIDQRRRYIKSRIQSALMASDREAADNWQAKLKELENEKG